MPDYRIYQLRQEFVEAFRNRAPKAGRLTLRDSRYEEVGAVSADSPYEAWKLLQERERPEGVRELGVGDVLQLNDEAPLVCTWWGFDEAQWMSAEREAALAAHEEVGVQAPV